MTNDWNDPRNQEAHLSAMISSFCTYVRRYNLPLKNIGKVDIDKIPAFVCKKHKVKKISNNTPRGHNFSEYICTNPKIICNKCKQQFWGIGNQGLICQSKLKYQKKNL